MDVYAVSQRLAEVRSALAELDADEHVAGRVLVSVAGGAVRLTLGPVTDGEGYTRRGERRLADDVAQRLAGAGLRLRHGPDKLAAGYRVAVDPA